MTLLLHFSQNLPVPIAVSRRFDAPVLEVCRSSVYLVFPEAGDVIQSVPDALSNDVRFSLFARHNSWSDHWEILSINGI